MNIKLKYLSREKSGLFLYFRAIPADLRQHYSGRALRRQSLQTHDPSIAAKGAMHLAGLDDQLWAALRNGAPDIETAHMGIAQTQSMDLVRRIVKAHAPPPEHHFSDALAIYLRKNRGRDDRFVENAKRVFARVKDVLGDRALSKIKRSDARLVLDSMLAENLKTSSVRRYLAVMSAIFSAAILEFELGLRNPFSSLEIPNFLEDRKNVPAFTEEELRQIATAGLAERSEQGLIATMQINLGCRVREISMLRVSDIHLDGEIPHVEIRQHLEHARRLKTGRDSERTLPLLGVSLQAAKLAMTSANNGWVFPRINKKNPSDSVNAWLRKTLGGKPGSHMARHSLETRLVLARIGQRLVDAVMGHKPAAKMGSVYFSGFGLLDLAEALGRIAIPCQ